MMLRPLILAALPLAAAGCATDMSTAPAAPIPVERQAITYSTQPCFGTCPVYRVSVTPEGQGVFIGERHTAATGEHRFQVTSEVARRFADHLASVRPASGDRRIDMQSEDCGIAPTDMPGIAVEWASNTGAAPQTLSLYLGCRSVEAQRVAGVLRAAPDMLPIADFIGKR
ncbi:DUF6438 domain-containing protein [Sphingomonas sp.]|uniref:DUF6438 domain-containing protein n=1 Tax=Sphingomonas sp. TaxID=28214 RepID=UPI002B66524C|nr:DUF6438 domain-containing protein [Sphingomonas sp.]HTG38110.1 DUF6438 domain-containing protein [Sphingomonas sp.]